MIAAASQVSLTVIFNPASGPASSFSSQYGTYLTNLENAGGTAVAYVWTDYGQESLTTVEGEIQTYISQYGKLINGFLLDGMSDVYDTTAADVTYYNTLYNDIKGLSSSYQVIGNPGGPTTTAYLNPSAPTANTLETFENAATSYTSANTIAGYPSSQFANVIYDQSSAAGMDAEIKFAIKNNVGYIYVTDQNLPNPYAQLPSYWNQEVAFVAALSGSGTSAFAASSGAVAGTTEQGPIGQPLDQMKRQNESNDRLRADGSHAGKVERAVDLGSTVHGLTRQPPRQTAHQAQRTTQDGLISR